MILEFSSFAEIFEIKELKIPYVFNDSDFRKGLKFKFQVLEESLAKHLDVKYKKELNMICKALLEVLDSYYNGQPKKAFEQFDRKIGCVLLNSSYFSNKRIHNQNFTLFRIRSMTETQLIGKRELFHIPFNQRRKISPSRYSIQGYPSLYLSESIDDCRMETKVDKYKPGYVASFRFREVDRVRILDLSIKPHDLKEKVNIYESIIDYIMLYPIIAACSVKTLIDSSSFYPEYGISQLLLQWLRNINSNDNVVIGIKYFTSRSVDPKIEGHNFVLATRYIDGTSDYCPILSNGLMMTEPIFYNDLNDAKSLEFKLKLMKHETLKQV